VLPRCVSKVVGANCSPKVVGLVALAIPARPFDDAGPLLIVVDGYCKGTAPPTVIDGIKGTGVTIVSTDAPILPVCVIVAEEPGRSTATGTASACPAAMAKVEAAKHIAVFVISLLCISAPSLVYARQRAQGRVNEHSTPCPLENIGREKMTATTKRYSLLWF